MKKLFFLSLFLINVLFQYSETRAASSLEIAKASRAFIPHTLAIDHLFVFVDEKDILDEKFKEHDFFVTTHFRPHKGQGTAGRFVYFKNIYLEFLYVYSPLDAIENIKNVSFDVYEKSQWKANRAFPFGIGYTLKNKELWTTKWFADQFHFYSNVEWMKGKPPILIDKHTQILTQPMNFLLVDRMGYEAFLATKHSSLQKSKTTLEKTVTSIDLYIPKGHKNFERMYDFQLAMDDQIDFNIVDNEYEWLLTLTCDYGKENKTLDLRPEIPVVIKY